jgi:serine/threonine-protein phosphatase 6 regulatory ankyrin repeat subunit B
MDNIPARDMERALLTAARWGYQSVVRTLVGKNVEINTPIPPDKTTPLLVATKCRQQGVIELLLEKGADIEAKIATVSHLCYSQQRMDVRGVSKLLLKKGADIEAKDCYGCTALPVATQNGYERVVRLLLDNNTII